jgi:hypothetical protein
MGRDKEDKLTKRVRTLERVVGGFGQSMKDMAEYFDGKDGEFGAMLYRMSVTLSSVIELLGIDDAKLTEITNRRDAENAATARERHEAAQAKKTAAEEVKAKESGEAQQEAIN